MRARALVAVGFLEGFAVLSPAPAAAAAPESGAEVAVRIGVALPAGSLQNNETLSNDVAALVPIVLEGGYRFDPTLFVGAQLQYAFADVRDGNGASCANGVSCSGSDTTLAAEGIYRFLADARFAPWVGLALGYEWLERDVASDDFNAGAHVTLHSWQATFQGGGDVRVAKALALGPFVQAQVGRYDGGNATGGIGRINGANDVTINDTAWHAWIAFGVRGAFGF